MHIDKRKWKLRFKLLKMKWRMFYMRYIKIIILAIVEVIAELYSKRGQK